MPLLKTKQTLSSMLPEQTLKVISTDAGSWRDIPAYVELTHHELVERVQLSDQFIYYIKKGV